MVASMTAEATRALGRELIDTFGKGWQKGNVDTMLSVFADQAVFFETPFTSPLTGTEQIRGYWGDVPAHQAEVTFTSGEIYGAGPWFSTEFKVTYRRRRTGEWVEARGALFCETDGEKVTEMRMYWQRK
jgi:ketosteroid isomerase-like protein